MLTSALALLYSQSVFSETVNIHTNDVVVTANRIAQNKDAILADVSIIDREQIERAGQSSLVEILNTQPGIEIETSGSIGDVTNIHIRGNSSQSVVVLIDGMRIASATLGTTNFSQIQPEQIERIEILRGPASSLYGSDAIGGVIQIFTKQGKGDLHLDATAGYGSYNTQQAAASLSGAVENTKFFAGVSSLTTNGISSKKINSGLDADHDSFRNLNFNGNISHTWADGQEIGAQLYSSNGHGNFDNNNFPAYQDSRQESYALSSNNKILDNWTSHLRLGKSSDSSKNIRSAGSSGLSYLRTKQNQFTWQNDIKLPLGTLVLAYDRLEDKVDGTIDFSQKKRINNGYLASYAMEQDAHAFSLDLRRDYNSQFGSHSTGNIAYGYKLNSFWKASASFGTAYRAPTFNDLYWPFADYSYTDPDTGIFIPYTYQGNKDLKPETSRNKEASVTYDQGHHKVSLTAYQNEINNLLVCCNGTSTDHPENVGAATINGVTLAYEGWFSNYHMRASADIQDPRNDVTDKLLTRRSKEHGVIWLGYHWNKWDFGGELVASGKRYNDAENAIKLGGYSLFNLTTNYRVNPDWSINARVNNLFDKEYALSTTATTDNFSGPDYNTMGMNVFVSARYSPNK